jgi:hypothetical protein
MKLAEIVNLLLGETKADIKVKKSLKSIDDKIKKVKDIKFNDCFDYDKMLFI